MANSVASSVATFENQTAEATQSSPSRIAKWTERAVDFVLKRAGVKVEPDEVPWNDQIAKQMIVVAACGRRVGCVEEIVGDYIKLVSTDQYASLIPLHWVDRVDSLVFLDRDFEEFHNAFRRFK